MNCIICKKEFEIKAANHLYCSKICSLEAKYIREKNKQLNTPIINCLVCNKETHNPKFCSKSCSAKWTNVHYPKRKTKKKCIDCGKPVISYRHTRCLTHHQEFLSTRIKNKTIGEYRNLPSVKNKHPSWLHAHIRSFARTWNSELKNSPCKNCGYNKHVEICHIKPVSSFQDDALLKDVNGKENVVGLCRNCHWELDNGLLDIAIIT